jgi:hypothetical protein
LERALHPVPLPIPSSPKRDGTLAASEPAWNVDELRVWLARLEIRLTTSSGLLVACNVEKGNGQGARNLLAVPPC